MQLTEPFKLRKMFFQPDGHFAVQPAARELSRSKNYIYQNKSTLFEKLRV